AGAVSYRWCPGPIPVNGDGGTTGDGGGDGGDGPTGVDGGVGSCNGSGFARGDFDGDGILDCVLIQAPDVFFYKGLPGSVFSTTPVFSPRAVPREFTGISDVVDMTGDGRADVIFFDRTPTSTHGYIAVGRVDGTFRSASFCRPPGGDFYVPGSFFG